MKNLLLLVTIVTFSVQAQEEPKVMEPVNQLFEGMKKGDSVMVRNAFLPKGRLSLVVTDPGSQPVIQYDSFSRFLVRVANPQKDVWTELIWNPRIEIDGNMAQVWAPYAFYNGKTFSHCGIDAFQLFKNAKGEWKILQLTFTQHKEGCNIPAEVSDKMK